MNDKVYVDGGIVIKTPFFKYKKAGARYGTPPEGSEILKPKGNLKGEPCLIIKEEERNNRKIVKAPSFFKEYYARTFFASRHCFASYFSKSIEDCFTSFCNKKDEVLSLINHNDVFEPTRQTLYRLSIVSVVAALDTLISDLVLFIATKDRDSFLKAVDLAVPSSNKKNILKRIIHMWCDNAIDSAEQEVIDHILRKSYADLDEIKKIFKSLYNIDIEDNKQVEEMIYWRHLISHRNGRKKDGSILEFDKSDIYHIIETIDSYVKLIKTKIELPSKIEINNMIKSNSM